MLQGTFVNHGTDLADSSGTMVNYSTGEGTMLQHSTGGPGNRTMSEIESDLGTMVINAESVENTMKQYGTAPGQQNYRPDFLDHFDAKESRASRTGPPAVPAAAPPPAPTEVAPAPAPPSETDQMAGLELARQLQQIAGGASVSPPGGQVAGSGGRPGDLQDKFQRSITDGDFEFLKFLSYDELTSR